MSDSDGEISVGGHPNNASDSDEEEVYEVEKILEMKMNRGKREFKVRWKNYGPDEDSWEPEANLGGAKEVLEAFLAENPQGKKQKKTPAKNSKNQSKKRPINTEHNEEAISDVDSDDQFELPSRKKVKRENNSSTKKKMPKNKTQKADRSTSSTPFEAKKQSVQQQSPLEKALNQRMGMKNQRSWLDSDDEEQQDNNSTTIDNTMDNDDNDVAADKTIAKKQLSIYGLVSEPSIENGKKPLINDNDSEHTETDSPPPPLDPDANSKNASRTSAKNVNAKELFSDHDAIINDDLEKQPESSSSSRVGNRSRSSRQSRNKSGTITPAPATNPKLVNEEFVSPIIKEKVLPQADKEKEDVFEMDAIFHNRNGELHLVTHQGEVVPIKKELEKTLNDWLKSNLNA